MLLRKRRGTPEWANQAGILSHRIREVMHNIAQFMALEAEPIFSFSRTYGTLSEQAMRYPDVVAGVVDCVANTGLLTLEKLLESLDQERRNFSDPNHIQQTVSQSLSSGSMIRLQRRQRIKTAFEFVKSESTLAAKPLDFGLRLVETEDSR